MAKRDQFSLTLTECRRRTFSDTFKRDRVREIEFGLVRISNVIKQYNVLHTAICQWLRKSGVHKLTPERIIVETMSDTRTLRELKQRFADWNGWLVRIRLKLIFERG